MYNGVNFSRYLEDEYLQHCPPSNISSGFASLPLPYVYTNGVPDLSRPTTGRLPGGEKFSGKNAYLILLSHFTTYNITPEEVDKIADEKLKELFPQVRYDSGDFMTTPFHDIPWCGMDRIIYVVDNSVEWYSIIHGMAWIVFGMGLNVTL